MPCSREGAAASAPRVLMTTDAVGGVWSFTTTLAAGLTNLGWRVDLAVVGPPPGDSAARSIAGIRRLSLHHLGHALEWQDKAGLDVAGLRADLLALERRTAPDLVHLAGFREAAFGFAAPVLLTAHSCVGSWFAACRGTTLPPEWDAYAAGVSAGLAAADLVAAPSEAYLATLRQLYAGFAGGIVVPNGAPPPSSPPNLVREPFILAAGRCWDEAKNMAGLARIAPQLPWPVTMAGEGSRDFSGVNALGAIAQDELNALMERAAIFAAPARYEPFGLAILEAAQRGAALVLGDIPTLREIWQDAALFVAPDDDAAWTTTLSALASAPALRQALALRATHRARQLDATRMVQGYFGLYERLLRRPVHQDATDFGRRACA